MKKILIFLVAGLSIIGCQKENSTEYVINGKAIGVHNGVRVRLAQIDEKGQQVVIDSAIVMNEQFTINGSSDEPTLHFLSIDGTGGNVILMLENSNINIEFNKDIPMESNVIGSKSHEGYKIFQDGMLEYKNEGAQIMTEFRELGSEPAPEKRDSIKIAMDNLRERQFAYPLTYVKENNDKYFSLNLIQLESNRPNFNIAGYVEAFENLTPRLKESKIGAIVKQKLDTLYKEYEKIAHLEVGKIAPNFESQNPDGKTIKLNDIKGKATIIDFWAAWCGPCRKENPNVVRIYNKYHDQGLEIIGVSLDGERRQQDPKKAWLDAIEKDGLTWNQVSSLKYFDDPVAQLYNIQSIPATFLLDKEGKIIAKNLRGTALENKVKELLEKE